MSLLSVGELIFNFSAYLSALPREPTRGMVGCFSNDDCHPSWDMFVVVDFDKERRLISAIFPRIRAQSVLNPAPPMPPFLIQLGQDRLCDPLPETECNCPLYCVHDSSVCCDCNYNCSCGVREKARQTYGASFEPQLDNSVIYTVAEFPYERCGKFIGLKFVPLEDVNFFDTPLNQVYQRK